MTLMPSRTISISVDRPHAEVYAVLVRPESFARWASGLGDGLVERCGRWFTGSAAGEVEVSFTPANPFGVLDHRVMSPEGPVDVPMRVVGNGEGAEIMVTVFRQPGMDDARFAGDCDWVARDLSALAALLEAERGR